MKYQEFKQHVMQKQAASFTEDMGKAWDWMKDTGKKTWEMAQDHPIASGLALGAIPATIVALSSKRGRKLKNFLWTLLGAGGAGIAGMYGWNRWGRSKGQLPQSNDVYNEQKAYDNLPVPLTPKQLPQNRNEKQEIIKDPTAIIEGIEDAEN